MNDNTYLQSWAEKTSCFISQDSVQTDDETQGSVCNKIVHSSCPGITQKTPGLEMRKLWTMFT